MEHPGNEETNPKKKIEECFRVLIVCLVCLMIFTLGLTTSQSKQADLNVNCSVPYLHANIKQRLLCFNATEEDICADCMWSGVSNLYRVMMTQD